MLSIPLVKGAGESRTLVRLGVLALLIVLRTLEGVVGIFQREHDVRIHEVGQVLIGFRLRRPVFSHPG